MATLKSMVETELVRKAGRYFVVVGVFDAIKKELRRRFAVEAVIGHMKTDSHLGRNFLKGRDGDHANAVLTAVGYNLRLVLNWLRTLWRKILPAIRVALSLETALNPAS